MYKHFADKEVTGLNIDLIRRLDSARAYAGIPFVITSGLRTSVDNIDIRGVENSSHLRGYAVDLRCKNSRERFIITKALIQTGFTRLGLEIDHIHVDIDPEKDPDVIWR
jgi:hypothetical protein